VRRNRGVPSREGTGTIQRRVYHLGGGRSCRCRGLRRDGNRLRDVRAPTDVQIAYSAGRSHTGFGWSATLPVPRTTNGDGHRPGVYHPPRQMYVLSSNRATLVKSLGGSDRHPSC
jgi:hypothetical protein